MSSKDEKKEQIYTGAGTGPWSSYRCFFVKNLSGCFFSFFHRDYLCVLCAKLLQLSPTLCDPMDCSLPVSPVHGILQARILE